MRTRNLLTGLAAGFALAGPCYASFITGGVTFSDSLDAPGVSALAQGCTGTFGQGSCIPGPGTVAFGFVPGVSGQTLFEYHGFSFTIGSFGTLTHNAACNGSMCSDTMTFVGTGTVTGHGFDATSFSITWSGQLNCDRGALLASQCAGAMNGGVWSARIDTAVAAAAAPEPASLALLGLGIGLMSLVARRRSA